MTSLFVGNIPKEVSEIDVVSHFRKVGVTMLNLRLVRLDRFGKSKVFGFGDVADEQIHDAISLNGIELADRKLVVQISRGKQPGAPTPR